MDGLVGLLGNRGWRLRQWDMGEQEMGPVTVEQLSAIGQLFARELQVRQADQLGQFEPFFILERQIEQLDVVDPDLAGPGKIEADSQLR